MPLIFGMSYVRYIAVQPRQKGSMAENGGIMSYTHYVIRTEQKHVYGNQKQNEFNITAYLHITF